LWHDPDTALALLTFSCESPLAVFVRGYAIYTDGEREREERARVAPEHAVNASLGEFEEELAGYCAEGDEEADPFILYLFGIVLQGLGRNREAADTLARSLCGFPCNWSAWESLSCLVGNDIALIRTKVKLPQHWSWYFFCAHVTSGSLSMLNEESSSLIEELLFHFPLSTELLGRKAQSQYHSRDLDDAEILFEKVLQRDPYRLEGLDSYSDILLVKEKQTTLSTLARHVIKFAKFEPESSYIVGNYYSMKANHDKAVLYFQRAIRLKRDYLAAWTLMGHEYVELKDTAAAVEAYRHAVDMDPRDYKAWYGLGQTYEILKMPLYSLYYYQKAAHLRPSDARMWCAVANCYESLSQSGEAMRCYRRAESLGDTEGIALTRLAALAKELGEEDTAAGFCRKILSSAGVGEGAGSGEVSAGPQDLSQGMVDALIFLAKYCFRKGLKQEARRHCERLLDCPVPERDDARAILARLQEGGQAGMSSGMEGVERSPPLARVDFNAHGGLEGVAGGPAAAAADAGKGSSVHGAHRSELSP